MASLYTRDFFLCNHGNLRNICKDVILSVVEVRSPQTMSSGRRDGWTVERIGLAKIP